MVLRGLRPRCCGISDLGAVKQLSMSGPGHLGATMTGVRAGIMKPETFEAIPTFVNIKSKLTALILTVKTIDQQVKQLMA